MSDIATPENVKSETVGPVKKRHVVLDALRGFALLGIALANFPEFSLYNFLSDGAQACMPSAQVDGYFKSLLALFVDGKFYSIFSILFGIGFSIILGNAAKKGANGMKIFYRRMSILAIIGLCHLLFIWSGDILLLYAVIGMILPLFRGVEDRKLLFWAAFFLILPVGLDGMRILLGASLAEPLYDAWWAECARVGITEENFATWLRDAVCYGDVFCFLRQGAIERMWEFVLGHRYFKVLGLFLIGYYIGKKQIFADLDKYKKLIERAAIICLSVGLPLSVLYSVSSTSGHCWGDMTHSVLYAVSVYPTAIGYMAFFAWLYMKSREWQLWKILALPGRMALSSYIGQSLIGAAVFYGTGLGLGCSVGLDVTICVAVETVAVETVVCGLWLKVFKFGPLEWVWRMLTYGKWLPIV